MISNVKVEFQCRPATSDVTYTKFLTDYGWNGSNEWEEIVIPISDFFAPNPVDLSCLSTVIAPFMITIADLPFFNTFYADYARWETPNSHPGASSVTVQGRQLLVDGEPFVVNGMDYAPISIGENWQGGWRDRADRYSVDFPLIAASGANAVRLYAPILSKAMLDAAWAEGLYVIPTFGVDAVQLTCAEGKAYMQDRFEEYVLKWKDHPAILFWLVGNEVDANLGSADLCTDWYPQLDALAQRAHAAEGAGFHPVGTAASDVNDVCLAGCSDDTALPNVDLWGTQLYRGCSFGGAFNEYETRADCARPLIVTEFGVDAWDSVLSTENQNLQADCLDSLLIEADQELNVRTGGVSSGQVIFEWADEWWKSECDPGTDWAAHDTCTSWTQPGYTDPGINEEWWGMVALDAGDPNARTPRVAHDRVDALWNLGSVCSLDVVDYDNATGDLSVSFGPAAGSSDHTLYYGSLSNVGSYYYGPLSAVSSYGYSGSVSGLGANGSGSATLPAGSLFWIVVPRNNGAEGSYGRDSACAERPASGGASVPQSPNRNWQCDWCS